MLFTLLIMFAVLGLGFALMLWHARLVFSVELRDGAACVRRGKPPSGFVRGCEDVARQYRLTRGRIDAVRTDGGVQLRFSRHLPTKTHQAFRNAWTPPPSGGGGGGMRATG
ncbi:MULTISPECIES: DUF3634 family protein [unclassified Thioalkalivibrio]|uniref:DUF3634 family protein n=1 Tax=unclassified Thioalkalivibrio TaxID=2621013 RepID=UPI00038228C3|nr:MULTISPECIES: DUF3634 family protein [unclassified Thioalkalivibrio]